MTSKIFKGLWSLVKYSYTHPVITLTWIMFAIISIVLWHEITHEYIIVDKFIVPKTLEEKGITGETLARGLIGGIALISAEGRLATGDQQNLMYDGMEYTIPPPDISSLEIAGNKFSIPYVAQLLRNALPFCSRLSKVSGEVIGDTKDGFILSLRVDGKPTFSKPFSGHIDGTFNEAAQYVLEHTDLYMLLLYMYHDANFESFYKEHESLIDGKKDQNIYLLWARYLYEKNNLDGAISAYDKILELNPKDANAYINRAVAYGKKGDYDKAIAGFNKAIELDPKNARAYSNRGIVYKIKGVLDKAIADYDRAIEIDPKLVAAYYNRGLAYDERIDYDKAITDYGAAIKLDQEYADAYFQRGTAYGKKGDIDKAIDDLNKAIELDPKDAMAYNNRGMAYSVKENYDKAIADYAKAFELDPKLDIAKKNFEEALKLKTGRK